MLKDYEIDKPILETDRLLFRVLNEGDVADLKEWLGRDGIYYPVRRGEHAAHSYRNLHVHMVWCGITQ